MSCAENAIRPQVSARLIAAVIYTRLRGAQSVQFGLLNECEEKIDHILSAEMVGFISEAVKRQEL